MSFVSMRVISWMNAPAAHSCFAHGLSKAAELKNLRPETVMQSSRIYPRLRETHSNAVNALDGSELTWSLN
jgi:hypothetical protein